MQQQLRYLVRFSDGGVGMRQRKEPLEAGQVIEDGGETYLVEMVEPPPSDTGSAARKHAGSAG
jgi:hypothetical protein